MHQIKKISFLFLLISILFVTSGCVSVKSTKDTSNVDGGIFKTFNKGDTWQQKVLIPTTSGKPGSFAGMSVSSMIIDPSDEKAVYFGSEANGLLYSYNGGEGWQPAGKLIQATIKSIAIDPSFKCTIYAAIGNRLYKSTDCNRSWSQVYYDNDVAAKVVHVVVDQYNSSNVYILISRGDVVKSSNGGQDWQTITRIKGGVQKMIINPNDSRKMYVVTSTQVFKTIDGGENWEEFNSLQDKMKELKLSNDIKDFVVTKSEEEKIFVATFYGLIKSRDGGQNWATKKLPTTKAGWALLIDPTDPNIIYMGVKGFEKK